MENEMLKEKIKETYGNIAQTGNSGCCTSEGCCAVPDFSPKQTSSEVGYDNKTLESIPESSILGLGCGIPVDFANLKEGETVVDLGSGAGIDVFLASKKVQKNGKIIGIDFTDKMLAKARNAAQENGFSNVEFRKGDIEERIPVEDSTVDVAISNCVINLATDKGASDIVNLGRLKGNIGNQNYPIPDGTDLTKYDTVLIWCKAFSVLFGSAQLASPSQPQ
jgi:arsenite methyltransferase